MTDPLLGQTVSGCAIERLLGRGGMGSVYLARSAQGPVVVKFLAPELGADPRLRARFQREGETLRRIPPHPHVVQVHAAGEERQAAFLIMEYVAGESLAARLQRGPLDPAHAARVGAEVARGLAVLHGCGVIHRDVKPDNVVLTADGRAKIVDFGVAKDLFMTALTAPGQLLGTARYMAPEQWGEGGVDARCDLFALGATVYHLLAGSPPFEGELEDIADQAEEGDFEPLPPHVPTELGLVVARLLMPEPDYRYSSARECAEDLERALRGERCRIPCLIEGERRTPLLDRFRYTLGRDPTCHVVVEHPTVSRRHAQLRREPEGYVLVDLQSRRGTFVGDERVERPRQLTDGDAVRLGDQRLTFHDPRRPPLEPLLLQPHRTAWTASVVAALIDVRDPRAALTLLERLAPDPWAASLADAQVSRCLGPAIAASAARARAAAEHRDRAQAPALLAELAGEHYGDAPGPWLAWWCGVVAQHREQVGVHAPPLPPLVLEGAPGQVHPERLTLDTANVLVGRDERCQLRLGAGAPRLQCRLVRLLRRWVVRDEAGDTRVNARVVAGAFVAPGDVLGVARAELRVAAAPPAPSASGAVDGATFEALVDLRHPSTARGLAARASRASGASAAAAAQLFPRNAAARERFARALREREQAVADRARAALSAVFARPPQEDWLAYLAQRAASLPPQLVPWGLEPAS